MVAKGAKAAPVAMAMTTAEEPDIEEDEEEERDLSFMDTEPLEFLIAPKVGQCPRKLSLGACWGGSRRRRRRSAAMARIATPSRQRRALPCRATRTSSVHAFRRVWLLIERLWPASGTTRHGARRPLPLSRLASTSVRHPVHQLHQSLPPSRCTAGAVGVCVQVL
jgi:hypothetical protein